MKVLLIKPPIRCFKKLTDTPRHAPIGLMYLSRSLKNAGIETRIFDGLTYIQDSYIVPHADLSKIEKRKTSNHPFFSHIIHTGASWQRIRQAVERFKPDVTGITCLFSPYYRQAYDVANVVRHTYPKTKIVMGGPHATIMWRHVLENSSVDAVLLGEGEHSFAQFILDTKDTAVHALSEQDIRNYPGLITSHQNWENITCPKTARIADIDELAFPTLDEVDLSLYGNVASIVTSRGCPFSCSFCSVHSAMGKKFRARSYTSVLEELRYYERNGINTINIEDDNFTYDMNRVEILMEAICRSGMKLELRFPNGITAVNLTKGHINLFARAGVKKLFFGLESTDKATRKSLKKGFAKMKQIKELALFAKQRSIDATVSIITGLPHQSCQQMVEDILIPFLSGIGSTPNPFYPIAGTALYDTLKNAGLMTELDPEWLDPMNFPAPSSNFNRSDVADIYMLSVALFDKQLQHYHRKLILSVGAPSDSEIIASLKHLSLHVSGSNTKNLVLLPHLCFCKNQGIVHENSFTPDSTNNACNYSGLMLVNIMQLWTGKPYTFRKLTDTQTTNNSKCAFQLSMSEGELPKITRLFIELVKQHAKNKPLYENSNGYCADTLSWH